MSWVVPILTIIFSLVPTPFIFMFILKKILPSILQSSMKLYFDKKLEDHKHELSQLLEGTKFNFARLTNDYSTFNQKRHEVYAELFRMLLIAEGGLGRYGMKLIERPNYSRYSESEIRDLLEEMKIPKKEIESICSMWESNPEGAIEEIYDWQKQINLNETRNAVREFHNELLFRELYLSPVVAKGFQDIDKVIREAEIYAKSYVEEIVRYKFNAPEIVEVRRTTMESLEKTLTKLASLKDNLKALMVKELQQGTEEVHHQNE